jgi:hypothetical protein
MQVAGLAPNTGRVFAMSVRLDGNSDVSPRTSPLEVWLKPAALTTGGTFVWVQQNKDGGWDVMTKRRDDDAASPLVQDGARNAEARVSADGAWVAYATDRSGRFEVVAKRLTSSDPPIPVSSGGGRYPRWRRDGRELYYLTSDFSQLMAVSVTPGTPPAFATPHKLFDVRLVDTTDSEQVVFGGYEYDVGDDAGSRFLINQTVREPVHTLEILLNWQQHK